MATSAADPWLNATVVAEQVEMHTFRNVSHKGILSDTDAVARVLDITHRYGSIRDDDSSAAARLSVLSKLRGRASHRRKRIFSFLQFADGPFRRWNLTKPHAEMA